MWFMNGYLEGLQNAICLSTPVLFDPYFIIPTQKNEYGWVILNPRIGVWCLLAMVEDCSHEKVDQSLFDNLNQV